MKRIFLIGTLFQWGAFSLFAQETNILTAEGSTNAITLPACTAAPEIDFHFSGSVSGENIAEDDPNYHYTYYIILYKDSQPIDTIVYESGDTEIACDMSGCPNIEGTFSFIPTVGTYYVNYKIDVTINGTFYPDSYNENSNSISVKQQAIGYAVCWGNETTASQADCDNKELEIYEFVSGTTLVVLKDQGLIYKFSGLGGLGLNMFKVSGLYPLVNTSSTTNYLQGQQQFNEKISDIAYTSDGYLLIGFNDGKLLKVSGLGGAGQNMFAVNETMSGFSSVPGYNYYAGHHKFNNKITDITHISGITFVSTNAGKILKVNGSGGGGANVFAIVENSSGFVGIPGYNYFLGSAKFNSAVTNIYHYTGQTILTFDNGKMLKINGTGGTGANMFAVIETSGGFVGLGGYSYYIGAAKFNGKVTTMMYQSSRLTIGFNNGKLLKVNGLGGSGLNMFAIVESMSGFSGIPGYSHYVGYSKYSSGVEDIIYAGGNTFITFSNGKLMKTSGIGGTGVNMYNATETSAGFVTTSTAYTVYLIGVSVFNVRPTDVKLLQSGELVFCFSNLKMFKSNTYGGTGANCFKIVQSPNGFTPLLNNTQHITGTAVFKCNSTREFEEGIAEEAINANENLIKAYPNPTNGMITLELDVFDESKVYQVTTMSIEGKVLSQQKLNGIKSEIDLSSLTPGIYFISVFDGVSVSQIKVVKID